MQIGVNVDTEVRRKTELPLEPSHVIRTCYSCGIPYRVNFNVPERTLEPSSEWECPVCVKLGPPEGELSRLKGESP